MKRSTANGKGGTRKAKVLRPEVLAALNDNIGKLEPTATVVSKQDSVTGHLT